MRLRSGLSGLVLGALGALTTPAGAARPATVLVATSGSESPVSERLSAELRSAGYQVYGADAQADLTCAAQAPIARSLQAYGEAAWAQISAAAEPDSFDIRVCYRSPRGQLSETAVAVRVSELDRGALAAVEALNGLRAEPSADCEPCAPVVVVEPAPKRSSQSGVAAGAGIVFDPLGVGPIVGATGGLRSGISERLGLVLDAFVPIQSREIERTDRRIAVDIAWVRVGPTLSWPLWILNVNAALAAGPALVWADAKTVAPLVGSSQRSAALVVSAGGSVELPRDSSWFLRAYYEVGGISPRIQIATAPREIDHLGPLLFQLGASLGLRWQN